MKEHKIKTVNDILKVVNSENIVRFMTDFYLVFEKASRVKEQLTEDELKIFKMPYFTWIDDNEHRIGYKMNGQETVWGK
jgi:uncharacterized protein (UPF0216 family)